jgi:hypothetical protein
VLAQGASQDEGPLTTGTPRYHRDVPTRQVRASITPSTRGWTGRIPSIGAEVHGTSQARCLAELRRAAGDGVSVIVEVTPLVAGVSEAAAILGWDRRRVITYVNRGSFPEPIAHLASGRVWRRDDIRAFARAWNRRRVRRAR